MPEYNDTGTMLNAGMVQTGEAGIARSKERARAYVDPVTGKENLTYEQLMLLSEEDED